VGSFELPLVPLIDVLLGIVLFLISSFYVSNDCSCVDEYVELPKASHVRDMVEAPVVLITQNIILVDGVMAGTTRDAETSGPPRRMAEIFNIMKNKRELWKQVNPGKEFPGATLLKIDRHVPMGVIRSVFQTVALAGYPSISFMVERRS
jgi:biopolymer transport protein ExbD